MQAGDLERSNLKTPGLNSRPNWPGASHGAGRIRVSVRRSVQALSGFVIRQRPRVGSRAVIPSPRLSALRCPRTRLCGPFIVGTANAIHIEAAVLDRLRATDATNGRRRRRAVIRIVLGRA